MRSAKLGNKTFDHIAEDVRETEVAAIVAVGQFFVIETELMQNGGVEVVDVDFVFHHVVAKLVGRAIRPDRP